LISLGRRGLEVVIVRDARWARIGEVPVSPAAPRSNGSR
jgi:hypothetical protein